MTGAASDALRDYLTTHVPEYSTSKIQFYYSSLPPKKHSNPTGYSSALNWWRRTLVDLVEKGLLSEDKLILTVDEELRDKLRWSKVGRPTSLGVIIAELAQSSDLIPLVNYLSSPLPPASTGESSFSVVSLLSAPFWWGLSKVWGSGDEKVDLGERADENEWKKRVGEWAVPDLVEKAAAYLSARLPDLHADTLSRLYTLTTFRDKLGKLCLPEVQLSEKDCRVLATYLAAKGECAFDGEVVKFSPPLSAKSATPVITESDRSTLSLLSTLSSLSSYINSLETRIAAERAQVQRYGVGESKNLALAKSHLVARKRLEKLLEERVSARDKVQEIVLGIERAVGDEETLSALLLGTTALRSILASPTLQLSNIEQTTSALDDALISAQEVNEAVDSVATPLTGEMEDEVDEELKALIAEEKKEKEEKKAGEEKDRYEELQKRLEAVKLPSLPKQTKEEEKKASAKKGEKLVA